MCQISTFQGLLFNVFACVFVCGCEVVFAHAHTCVCACIEAYACVCVCVSVPSSFQCISLAFPIHLSTFILPILFSIVPDASRPPSLFRSPFLPLSPPTSHHHPPTPLPLHTASLSSGRGDDFSPFLPVLLTSVAASPLSPSLSP